MQGTRRSEMKILNSVGVRATKPRDAAASPRVGAWGRAGRSSPLPNAAPARGLAHGAVVSLVPAALVPASRLNTGRVA